MDDSTLAPGATERPATGTATSRQPAPTAQWTRAIANGDEAAFSAFYAVWFPRVHTRAERLLRSDPGAVADVVQETMLKVARRMTALDDERAVTAWMARTVFTAAMDRLRKDRRRRQRERHAAAHPEDRVVDATEDAQLAERLRWLREELAGLAPEDRQLLAARFAGDATFKALGDEFAMSGHAVAGKIRRALAKLRERAETFFDG